MTWIVGTATPFGYGTGISDIRVTLGTGAEMDCLQKIYPVGQFLAAGFAGSVAIGFAMIETLVDLLRVEDQLLAWDPVVVADWWPGDARKVFAKFPIEERNSQSHIILIGVHPTINNGDTSWARSYVYRFCSPNFDAVEAKPREVVAIGCGTAVQPCQAALDSLSTDHEAMFNVMRGEQGTSGGMASLLGWQLTEILKKTQPTGISSNLHYCWVYRGRIVVKTNDHVTTWRWSRFDHGVDAPGQPLSQLPVQTRKLEVTDSEAIPTEHFMMPNIAKSWDELCTLLRADVLSAVGAVG